MRIRHGHTLETLYAHLLTYRVRVDQQVRRGEVIGYVSNTGVLSADPHLHLGMFLDGIAIDPLSVLKPYTVRTRRRALRSASGERSHVPRLDAAALSSHRLPQHSASPRPPVHTSATAAHRQTAVADTH